MTIALSWLKKNTVTVFIVIATALVMVLAVLGFWLKIRGFRVADLFLKLQHANARNENNHLKTRRAVLQAKEGVERSEIKEIEAAIKEEDKKAEIAKAKLEGLSSEDIAARLSDLGF